MQDKTTYHSSAIVYNDMFVEVARAAADKVEDPKVKEWCTSIAKQHEFHAKRHRAALAKLERKNDNSNDSATVEATVPATATSSDIA